MDIHYFMKIQNAYGTNSHREKELAIINLQMSKHFEDTYDTEDVLINGLPSKLMIIKDTDGNTFKKKIKSCHENKFNLGDSILWNNQHWLVTLLDPDEKTWNRGYMYLCTVPLRWQNSDGKIIERWAYSEDFTKYSSGITGNNTLKVGDNQYGLTLPIDSETKKLKRDKRFAIDFDDAEEPDIYVLTNRKVNLNNNQYFNRGGIMSTTMSFDTFNATNDKYVKLEDGSQVWICDYQSPTSFPSPPDETTDLSALISCKGSEILKAGGNAKIFSVCFTDAAGDPVNDIHYTWEATIANEFKDCIITEILPDNRCRLKVSYDTMIIGNSVKLAVKDMDGKEIGHKIIEIGGGL